MHRIIEQSVTDAELNYFINYYNTHDHYTTHGMEKLSVLNGDDNFLNYIVHFVKEKLNIDDFTVVGDNFYRHSQSYFPHCDAIEDNAWYNIVVPLIRYNPTKFDQKFVVFDQIWQGANATWIGSLEMQNDFASNKKILARPCDSEFMSNCTDQQLPKNLWQHLDANVNLSQEYLFGLTGMAYNWRPGDLIVFDSHHIHATGNMQSASKLGLSIRVAHR